MWRFATVICYACNNNKLGVKTEYSHDIVNYLHIFSVMLLVMVAHLVDLVLSSGLSISFYIKDLHVLYFDHSFLYIVLPDFADT